MRPGFTVRDAEGRLRVGLVIEPIDQVAPLASAGAVLFGADGRPAGRWTAVDPSERPILGAIAVTAWPVSPARRGNRS